jgi:hypothetical protein
MSGAISLAEFMSALLTFILASAMVTPFGDLAVYPKAMDVCQGLAAEASSPACPALVI